MGISYHPVAMFGVRFKKIYVFSKFLETNTHLKELDEVDDVIEFIEQELSPLKVTRLNLFSTQEVILGYNMVLGETIEKYQEIWDKQFTHAQMKPEPILDIRLN